MQDFLVCGTAQQSQAVRHWGTVNQAVRSPYIPRMPLGRCVQSLSFRLPAGLRRRGRGPAIPPNAESVRGEGGPRPALGMERGFPQLPQALQVVVLSASLATAVLMLRYPCLNHRDCPHLWPAHPPHVLGAALLYSRLDPLVGSFWGKPGGPKNLRLAAYLCSFAQPS